MSFKGKNAVVTGGAAGIGLETAKELLRECINKCVILDVDVKAGNAAIKEMASNFGENKVIFEKCDVSNRQEFETVMERVMESLGTLQIFINNAGIEGETRWERILQINLQGAINGCQIAMKYMSKENGKPGGAIFNMCSLLGLEPAIWPVYSASKSGLIGYTRCIGDELSYSKTGVKVMAFCPGPVETAMIQGSLESAGSLRDMVERGIMEHGGYQSPAEIASKVVSILKADKSGSIWIGLKGDPVYEYNFRSTEKDAQ